MTRKAECFSHYFLIQIKRYWAGDRRMTIEFVMSLTNWLKLTLLAARPNTLYLIFMRTMISLSVYCIFHKVCSNTTLTVCYYHVTYAFQSESTPYSCLNVKELLVQKRHDIWSLRSDSHLPKRFALFASLKAL